MLQKRRVQIVSIGFQENAASETPTAPGACRPCPDALTLPELADALLRNAQQATLDQ